MFQWLQMRIGEEQDRRKKEAEILALLPGALEDLRCQLAECVAAFDAAFGPDQAGEVHSDAGLVRITARERQNGRWQDTAKVEVTVVPALPGFKVEHANGEPILVEIGVLPGDKLYYRNSGKYLTTEEMTRRILDRVLFPKLGAET